MSPTQEKDFSEKYPTLKSLLDMELQRRQNMTEFEFCVLMQGLLQSVYDLIEERKNLISGKKKTYTKNGEELDV